MKLVGILCWYDEPVSQLAACVASFAPALDHLVAVDGAYWLYPGAMQRPASDREQAETITSVCGAVGLSLTLHVPNEPFMGNEVEKRNLSLDLARTVAGAEDYVVVFDADMEAHHVAGDLRSQLEEERPLVASYGLGRSLEACESIYQLLPSLVYGPAHWTISIDRAEVDGETDCPRVFVRGNRDLHDVVDPYDLTRELKVDHHHNVRSTDRRQAARDYYRRRDELGVERLTVIYTEGLNGELVER